MAIIGAILGERVRDVPWFLEELTDAAEVAVDTERLGRELFMSWDDARALGDSGGCFAIGSHAHSHLDLAKLDALAQRRELVVSKEILERRLGREVMALLIRLAGGESIPGRPWTWLVMPGIAWRLPRGQGSIGQVNRARTRSTGWVSDQVIHGPCSERGLRFARRSGSRFCEKQLDQSDQDNFGPAEEPGGWRDGAHASSDEDLATRCLNEPVQVFLTVTRWDNGGTQSGYDDLPAVGVAAQDQSNSAVQNCLGEIGVVGKHNRGIALGGIGERRVEILMVGPEVTDAADSQSRATTLDPHAGVIQVRQTGISQRGR